MGFRNVNEQRLAAHAAHSADNWQRRCRKTPGLFAAAEAALREACARGAALERERMAQSAGFEHCPPVGRAQRRRNAAFING